MYDVVWMHIYREKERWAKPGQIGAEQPAPEACTYLFLFEQLFAAIAGHIEWHGRGLQHTPFSERYANFVFHL